MCFVGASTAIKIFIGEGEQEGEVIRQFQPGDWERQFSIKDADYGDLVLKHLRQFCNVRLRTFTQLA